MTDPKLTVVPNTLDGIVYDVPAVLEAAVAALDYLSHSDAPGVVSGVQQILMVVEQRLRE